MKTAERHPDFDQMKRLLSILKVQNPAAYKKAAHAIINKGKYTSPKILDFDGQYKRIYVV